MYQKRQQNGVRWSEKRGGNGVLRESCVEVEAAEEEALEETSLLLLVVERPRRSLPFAVAEGGGEGGERELRRDQRGLRR